MSKAVTVQGPKGFSGTFGESSYAPDPTLSYEDWAKELELAVLVNKKSPWWIGDLYLFGENRFGHAKCAQIMHLTGKEESTVRNAAWVCKAFPPDQRHSDPDLTFSHHLEVAGCASEKERTNWLDLASEYNWSTGELRRRRKGEPEPHLDPARYPDLPTLPGEENKKNRSEIRSAVDRLVTIFNRYIPETSSTTTIPTSWGKIHLEFEVDENLA